MTQRPSNKSRGLLCFHRKIKPGGSAMRGVCAKAMLWSVMTGVAVAQTPSPAPQPQQSAQDRQKAAMAEALKTYHGPKYVRSEVMIPVRDGVKLHTVIVRPEGSDKSGDPLPFLMTRTPYGVDGVSPESVELGKRALAASGYIYVYQDI